MDNSEPLDCGSVSRCLTLMKDKESTRMAFTVCSFRTLPCSARRHHHRHVNLDLVRAVAELTRNRRQKNKTKNNLS